MEYGNRSFLVLVLCSFAANVYSIKFTLLPNTQKCLRDNVQPHQLNVMEFSMNELHQHEFEYHVSVPVYRTHICVEQVGMAKR